MSDAILGVAPLSISDLIEAIRVQSKDEKSNPVFSDDQIKLAIRQAILNSQSSFFTSATTTIEYQGGNYGPYVLPPDVQRIVLIVRERGENGFDNNFNTLHGKSAGEIVTSYRHFRNRAANHLYFTRDFLSSTMTIHYERDVSVPIDDRYVQGDHSAVIETITLVDEQPYLWQMELPAYMRWDSEIIKVKGVSGNTQLTDVERGQLGTTATAHANGSAVSQLILANSQRLESFLFPEIGRLLNQWRVQQGNKNVSVAANITAAGMFREDSELALRRAPQSRKTRRLSFIRSRRPRRRL